MADKVAQTIQDTAAEQIAQIGPRVEKEVVDLLVTDEVAKRVTPIKQGIELLKRMDIELKKLDKPDMIFTMPDGEKVEAQTPKKVEEVKKHKEKTDKLLKAIQKAWENGDVQDLNQLIQSGKPGKDMAEGKPGSAEETAT